MSQCGQRSSPFCLNPPHDRRSGKEEAPPSVLPSVAIAIARKTFTAVTALTPHTTRPTHSLSLGSSYALPRVWRHRLPRSAPRPRPVGSRSQFQTVSVCLSWRSLFAFSNSERRLELRHTWLQGHPRTHRPTRQRRRRRRTARECCHIWLVSLSRTPLMAVNAMPPLPMLADETKPKLWAFLTFFCRPRASTHNIWLLIVTLVFWGSHSVVSNITLLFLTDFIMVASCSAYGCTNLLSKGSDIKLHVFPKDTMQRAKWIQAKRRVNFNPTSADKLCSEHFLASDYRQESHLQRKILLYFVERRPPSPRWATDDFTQRACMWQTSPRTTSPPPCLASTPKCRQSPLRQRWLH